MATGLLPECVTNLLLGMPTHDPLIVSRNLSTRAFWLLLCSGHPFAQLMLRSNIRVTVQSHCA